MIELFAYWIVCVLGVARITLVVTVDYIGHLVRDLFDPESFMGLLLECSDCLSIWVAFPVAGIFLFSPLGAAVLMLPWAMAMVAALIARRY